MTPKRQITNLLFILLAGAACAILVTFFMLYRYGPEGHYLLKNALLSPQVLSQISHNEKNLKSNLGAMILEKIEFSYQDFDTKKKTVIPVSKDKYAQFYHQIAEDKSIYDVPQEIITAFNQMPASSLMILVQGHQKNASAQNPIFQEVQFLFKGDYYRLQLREASGTNWIYFYHPRVYDDAIRFFTGKAL